MVNLQDIYAARARVAGLVRHTSLEPSPALGPHIYLKPENLQRTGSFKLRGALNRILSMSSEEKSRGVIAASAGNHAQGVAFGCARAGVSAVIVMPQHTPRTKIQATQSYGVDIRLTGQSYDDAEAAARQIERDTGRVFVSAYNDAQVIAGQGTIALELLDDLPGLARVIVPVGGGGLIGGMAVALKAVNPAIQVIGVTSRAAPAMYNHLKGTHLPQLPTLAEGLSGEVEAGAITLELARLADDIVLVEESDIVQAIAWTIETHHLIVEGSGAVGIAALLSGVLAADAGPTAVVITGGNLDIDDLRHILAVGKV